MLLTADRAAPRVPLLESAIAVAGRGARRGERTRRPHPAGAGAVRRVVCRTAGSDGPRRRPAPAAAIRRRDVHRRRTDRCALDRAQRRRVRAPGAAVRPARHHAGGHELRPRVLRRRAGAGGTRVVFSRASRRATRPSRRSSGASRRWTMSGRTCAGSRSCSRRAWVASGSCTTQVRRGGRCTRTRRSSWISRTGAMRVAARGRRGRARAVVRARTVGNCGRRAPAPSPGDADPDAGTGGHRLDLRHRAVRQHTPLPHSRRDCRRDAGRDFALDAGWRRRPGPRGAHGTRLPAPASAAGDDGDLDTARADELAGRP